MKRTYFTAALGYVLFAGLAQSTLAAPVKTAGLYCWTGDIEYIATTKKDMGWSWSIDLTYFPDDKDPEKAASGRCFGTGGMIAGKAESSAEFCIIKSKDGSTYMSRIVGGAEGNKGMFFGGTGTYEGITGGSVGGPRVSAPAEKGKLAACRHVEAEFTTGE
jgi:hypothetical protein